MNVFAVELPQNDSAGVSRFRRKPSTKLRPCFKRTRTGCLTCRKRRKKCNEQRPMCLGCQRNRLECHWSDDAPIPALNAASSEDSPEEILRETLPEESDLDDVTELDSVYDDSCSRVMSPIRTANSALSLVPLSKELLRHYLQRTSRLLTTNPVRNNPFVEFVLPIALDDEHIMNAVLCLSGTHMSARGGDAPAVYYATYRHYKLAVTGLRSAITTDQPLDRPVVSMQRYHNGAIFSHLKACRELIQSLANFPAKTTQDTKVEGFLLEIYAYFSLVANITPYGLDEARTIPMDPLLSSLGSLKKYDTFGFKLSSIHDLFALIPIVSRIAQEALQSKEKPYKSDEATHWMRFLENKDLLLSNLSLDPKISADNITVADIYRQALLIYLKASLCGSVVNNPKSIVEIQDTVDEMFSLFDSIADSDYGAILLWPIMIMGSCLVRPSQQNNLRQSLVSTRYDTGNIAQAIELLDHLWNDESVYSYGPYGLYYIMNEHKINFCMS